jgi:hypothetical protein
MAKKTAIRRTSKRKSLSRNDAGLKHGFRSGLEETTADWLVRHGIDFGFEDRVILYEKPARTSKYTPDFNLPNGLIIETKGRFVTADRQKHLLVKKQHPELDIRFVFSNSNARISKQSKTTYAMWCEKHGFKYADKTIPTAWIAEKRKTYDA